MTSMLVNAGFAPQPAIPASIIFKERPLLEQVDAKELAKQLLNKESVFLPRKIARQGKRMEANCKKPNF
jgi:hypothetical protein